MVKPRLVIVPKPHDSVPRPVPRGDLDPDWQPIARRLSKARDEHLATLDAVRAAVATRALDATWLEEPNREGIASGVLVVTVGGDGTFLTVARHADRTPMLGVNSSPSTSVGHYCAATAESFGEALDAALGQLGAGPQPAGSAPIAPLRGLTRIRAAVGGVVVPFEALNDVLFAHRSPVASTRYALHIAGQSELQLSSGVWIATATGSTAAIRSAGGSVMDPDDTRLQWRVREPYVRSPKTLEMGGGFTAEPIEILSRSDKNALFLDGQSEPWFVPFGTRARVSRSPELLWAFLAKG